MIKNLDMGRDPPVFEKIELSSWSFTCAICDVLIGTCFDFVYNDDFAVKDKRVEECTLVCGKCRDEYQ